MAYCLYFIYDRNLSLFFSSISMQLHNEIINEQDKAYLHHQRCERIQGREGQRSLGIAQEQNRAHEVVEQVMRSARKWRELARRPRCAHSFESSSIHRFGQSS